MTSRQASLRVLRLPGNDPAGNLAFEEELFGGLRSSGQPCLLFYVNRPCVVLGRSNRIEEWAHAACLEEAGIPLLRRFSGGGAVYHDLDNLNFSFMLPRSLLDPLLDGPPGPRSYIDFFRAIVVRALERDGAGGYSCSGISDIMLNGRKISGNAQRIASHSVLHHGTLMTRCPLAAIEQFLPVPPNRPDISHSQFVTGLHEEGRPHSMVQLEEWIASELAASCALERSGPQRIPSQPDSA